MIKSFRHRGLKRLYQRNEASGIRPELVTRVAEVLAHLESAVKPADLDLPGYRLHTLKGSRKGFWSVTISGNWRLIFRMEEGDAFDVELLDYH